MYLLVNDQIYSKNTKNSTYKILVQGKLKETGVTTIGDRN